MVTLIQRRDNKTCLQGTKWNKEKARKIIDD